MQDGKKDFFVSYNQQDEAWAEWIAYQLESDGYRVVIQKWDFAPGSNFAIEMQRAAEICERTIIVLSPAFLASDNTQPEWAQAFAIDPTGEKRLLIPVRVAECELEGLFKPLVYIDFFRLCRQPPKQEKELVRQLRLRLLEGVKRRRKKPDEEPPLPGMEDSKSTFAASKNNASEVDKALESYLQALIERVKNIDLFHLKHLTGGMQFPVDQVYTPLKVNPRDLRTEGRDRSLRYIDDEQKEPRELGELLTLLFEQPEFRCMVVLGRPGAGKSTLLKYLAYFFAAGRQEKIWAGLAGKIPFFLRLKDVADRYTVEALKAASLPAVIKSQVDDFECGGLVTEDEISEWLRGNALLLLDGLDEVADENKRKVVSSWVKSQVTLFSVARFVISSRVYGFSPYYAPDASFTVEVDELSEAQQHDFLQLWFGHVHRQKSRFTASLEWQPETVAKRLAESLQDHGSHDHLKELASNPLLLSMIAIMQLDYLSKHKDAEAQLPASRSELYEQCIRLFIEEWGWDEVREVPCEQHLGFPFRELLENAALLLQAHQGRDDRQSARVGWDKLHKTLCERLPNDSAELAAVLKHSHERTLLLVEHGIDSWGFQHKTFQEYLCAEAIAHQPETALETFVDRTGDDHWRVVFDLFLERQTGEDGRLTPVLKDYLVLVGQRFEKSLSHARKAWKWIEQLHDNEDFHYPIAEQNRLQHIAWQWLAACSDAVALARFHGFAERGLPALALGETKLCERLLQVKSDELLLVHHLLLLPELSTSLNEVLRQQLEAFTAEHISGAVRGAAALALRRFDRATAQSDEALFVAIPKSSFYRGSQRGDDQAYDDEEDGGCYEIAGFQIGRYPVTNGEYQRFVHESGHKAPGDWSNGLYPSGKGNHPVVNVSWHDAQAYIEWLNGRSDGHLYRLPTEAQWERAARGPAQWHGEENRRQYPWGDAFDAQRCNVAETGLGRTTAVGAFPGGASPEGVLDMAGNVWEWCADGYESGYYQQGTVDENTEEGEYRVLRGGAFYFISRDARCACRGYFRPGVGGHDFGFRVARIPRP